MDFTHMVYAGKLKRCMLALPAHIVCKAGAAPYTAAFSYC